MHGGVLSPSSGAWPFSSWMRLRVLELAGYQASELHEHCLARASVAAPSCRPCSSSEQAGGGRDAPC
jgi:hypothetical protein